MDVFHPDHALTAALRLRKGEADFLSSLVGASIFSMRSICLSLLCLRCLGGFLHRRAGEVTEAGDLTLLILVGGEQLFDSLRAGRGNRRSCRDSG